MELFQPRAHLLRLPYIGDRIRGSLEDIDPLNKVPV